jgi:hypothetical protein
MQISMYVNVEDIEHIKSICFKDAECSQESDYCKLLAINENNGYNTKKVEIEIKDVDMFCSDLFYTAIRIGAKIQPHYKNEPLNI